MKENFLNGQNHLTKLFRQKGMSNWPEILSWVHQLPYGRNDNREDLSSVIREEKGTCSSKHALLKAVADDNKIKQVDLVMGIYLMHPQNTPGIASVLDEIGLSAIPEAHCYLSIEGKRRDFTFPEVAPESFQLTLLEERIIPVEAVFQQKIQWHQEFLKQWINKHGIQHSFSEIWATREACIMQLSLNQNHS